MKILVFAAHPDDCEIGMGGTIKKMSEKNHNIVVVDLTQGEMSSNGNIFKRQSEADNASKILGIQNRENLMLPDRNIVGHIENIKKIADVIRKHKPNIVFYPNYEDNHPDHKACSRLVKEGIFHSKLKKYQSEYDAFTVKKSYRYQINGSAQFDYYIDVSDTYEYKIKALKAYSSQFDLQDQNSKTRLNSGFITYLESRNRVCGFECGVEYAEGFITDSPLIFDTIDKWEAVSK